MDIASQIVCGVFLAVGLLLVIIGAFVARCVDSRRARCTSTTEGHITDHILLSKDPHPLVAYKVDKETYTVARRYRGVIRVRSARKVTYENAEMVITDRGFIRLNTRNRSAMAAAAEKLWPIGSPMTVYYDPNAPKVAYVEQIPDGIPLASIILFVMGIVYVAVVLLLLVALK